MAQSARLLEIGRDHNRSGDPSSALVALEEALALDPRFAELHYERGRALLAAGRTAEAKEALERARDEDVCPLRALSEMDTILKTVASATGTQLVDFIEVLERDLQKSHGHSLLGEEDFLDHVHPTIDGHRRLAVALTEAMRRGGILPASTTLDAEAMMEITRKVEAGIDRERQAEALASLAWTLDWAGKLEDSRRLALQALESGVETPRILLIAGRHFALEGDRAQAQVLFRRAIEADPLSPTPHYQMGLLAIDLGELEKAAAHFSLATVLWPQDAKAHEKLGLVMAERGRWAAAVASLREAKRRDPGREKIDDWIARVQNLAGTEFGAMGAPRLTIERYDSGVVRRAALSWREPAGRSGRPGIHAEWSESGALLRFADTIDGKPLGPSSVWSAPGALERPAAGAER